MASNTGHTNITNWLVLNALPVMIVVAYLNTRTHCSGISWAGPLSRNSGTSWIFVPNKNCRKQISNQLKLPAVLRCLEKRISLSHSVLTKTQCIQPHIIWILRQTPYIVAPSKITLGGCIVFGFLQTYFNQQTFRKVYWLFKKFIDFHWFLKTINF